MAILGLLDAESFSAQRFKNIRRSVFYFHPNGAATLTGILSMIGEEVTNDPEFKWFEKRLAEQRTTTASANAAGPFTATGTDTDLTAAGWSLAANASLRVKTVAGLTDIFRVGQVIKIDNVPTTGTAITIKGIITSFPATANTMEVRLLEAVSNALNNTTANGKDVIVIGSSYREGDENTLAAPYNLPIELGNYTQIFRTPFTITGTALKTSARFDETGVYKDKAKEHSVFNMIEIEKALMFGTKTLYTGGVTPQRTTGGILYHLQQWEAGTVYGNTAATADTDDNKRIIANTAGTLSDKQYDGLLERVFRVTNNTVNEKLVFCGSGFLSVINQLYKSKSVLNTNLPMEDTYGMNVVQHLTPFGTIYYKTHPLFSQNATLRYNALFVDVQNLKYRYLAGRDTELLTKRQPNDADYRKDEWLTECGLELRFPESHMYLQNVRDYVP